MAQFESDKLVDKAKRFAIERHSKINHLRKYTDEPYQVHLEAVAIIVATVSSDPEVIAASWLHDTVEDTDTSFSTIEEIFGLRVRQLVYEVTDISKPNDGNRQVRKLIDRGHLAQASAAAMTIKLADLIDNAKSITRYDPSFSKVYMQEMKSLLEVLGRGAPKLVSTAENLITDYCRKYFLTGT